VLRPPGAERRWRCGHCCKHSEGQTIHPTMRAEERRERERSRRVWTGQDEHHSVAGSRELLWPGAEERWRCGHCCKHSEGQRIHSTMSSVRVSSFGQELRGDGSAAIVHAAIAEGCLSTLHDLRSERRRCGEGEDRR
jgi:Fe-S-cluster containining protein